MAWDNGREGLDKIIEKNKKSRDEDVVYEWHDWHSSDGETWSNIDDEGNPVIYNPDGDDIIVGNIYKDFDAFLEKQELKKRDAEQTDWKKRREDWLRRIGEFYQLVQRFLRRYLDQGKVSIDFRPLTLNEEYIGSYETTKLHLTMGSHEVVFSPKGTRMIGSKGRIDMDGRAGKVRFLLADRAMPTRVYADGETPKKRNAKKEEASLVWKIATPPPSVSLIDLNVESFLDALLEVANG